MQACVQCTKSCLVATKQATTKCVAGIPPCLKKTKLCCKNTLSWLKKMYRKTDIFCGKLCTGRTSCWINFICFLPVLIYLSIKIYVIPCIGVVLGRIFTLICCCWCRVWCPEDYIFTDNEFPTNITSLQLKNEDVEKSVLWIRGHDLATKEATEQKEAKENDTKPNKPEMYLFRNGIVSNDVVQGQLGDCWLLAAIASLAEFPGAIENCFYSYEKNERHKYYIRLYDARKGIETFRKIYIDDYIPCNQRTKRPIFAKPKGNELWVLLLEKAFAKFMGNYGRMHGGYTLWAFQAMTGCYVMRWEKDKGNGVYEEFDEEEETKEEKEEEVGNSICWKKWGIEYEQFKDINNPKKDYRWVNRNEVFNYKRFWRLLRKYDRNCALIAASVSHRGENKRNDGIVEGHAYTVKHIFSFKKYKLMNIRNPWGSFEWKGKWSDSDKETWDQHKEIAEKVKFKPSNDGSFWMEYADFLQIFGVIEICDRTTISNLHLNINEDDNTKFAKYKLSICKGCIKGCFDFWCCCQGLINVYFGRKESSKSTIETKDQCCININI